MQLFVLYAYNSIIYRQEEFSAYRGAVGACVARRRPRGVMTALSDGREREAVTPPISTLMVSS